MVETIMKRRKIGLVGIGNIGTALAFTLASNFLICDELALVDIDSGRAQGLALDIAQASAAISRKVDISAGSNYAIIENADVVIVSAGIPRKPGMSRDDLLLTNLKIIKDVAKNVARYAPDALLIIITNPLDVIVGAAHKFSGFSKSKVVGMAGVLDSARYKFFLSEATGVHPDVISTLVIGAHGDTMVPLTSATTIGGISLDCLIETGFISKETVESIRKRVIGGGGEIVNLLKSGSAFQGPATSAALMADCYINNNPRVLPCSVFLEGQYGADQMFMGVPIVLSGQGVEKVIELKSLNEDERSKLEVSLDSLKALKTETERLMSEIED